ncbi:MAG: S8 family serine peptidase [Candidatus Competibacteraceae bacterium]
MRFGIPKQVVLILGIAGLLLQACGGGGGGGDSPPPPPATYTLSGVVRPASGTAIDSDVNDPNASYRSNDTIATAQAIPNPVTLGGYVNQPRRGANGRSFNTGDVVDLYRVNLLAGQPINLFIAGDGVLNDLDLGLFDLAGNPIDASAGQTRVESLTVSVDGEYLVVVRAYEGASNYVLTIGQALSPAMATGPRLSDSFVPGEAVVLLEKNAATGKGGLRAQAQALGWFAGREEETEPRNMLFDLTALQRTGALAAAATPGWTGELQIPDPELRDKLETLYAIKALNRDPEVKVASPNFIRQALFVPNDPNYPLQWHYPQINLPQTWDLTTGSDTIVAVIDTGVVLSHPDLQGQLVPGYDFISNPANAGDGDGIDPDPTDPGDRANPDRSSTFHGTHVTGTVAAATNNGIGVAGVAFNAKVMPLRALGRLGGTDHDIGQAVLFAAGLPNDSGTLPARRADVINLSLGGPGFSANFQEVFERARAAGAVLVAAAGNQATGTPFYPAAYPDVIAVSAVDINKQRAPYSNFGPWIDVAAPGGDTRRDVNGDGKPDGVLSTSASDSSGTLVNDYTFLQGTSMAAPHVAGVIALMKSAAPNLTPQDVADLLVGGALTDDLGPPGKDDSYGHGLINAYKAVTAAANRAGQPVDPTPILAVNPTALNFGTNLTSQTLLVSNGGSGGLIVNPPTEDSGGWLSVTPTQVDASGLGAYTITVRRAGLADGVYSATVAFDSNAGMFQAPVIMQVATELSAGAVGQQYVLLLDPATRKTVDYVAAQPQADGSHAFSLSGIPAGTYQLFAGSDSNNDLLICDEGESCGAYLTLDRPILLEVDRDLSGLEFVSGLTVNLAEFQRASAGEREPVEIGLRRSSRRQIGSGP